MKLSIAEVKRRLPVGTEFTAEFLAPPIVVRGNIGDVVLEPPARKTRRTVIRQGADMVSRYQDGPKAGNDIYLQWSGSSAREENGSIVLTNKHNGEDFLRITIG